MFSSDKETPSELIRAKDLSGFDVWALPSFDPHVEEPEPEPAPEPDPEPEPEPAPEPEPTDPAAPPPEEKAQMDVEARIRALLTELGIATTDLDAAIGTLGTEYKRMLGQAGVREQLQAAFVPLGCPEGEDMVRWATGEIVRLRPLADQGQQARDLLITETLAAGVRATPPGMTFAEETYKGLLAVAPFESIRQMRDDFEARARENFQAGRVTRQTEADPPAPAGEVRPPAAAFRTI